jgi:hypothetical protein
LILKQNQNQPDPGWDINITDYEFNASVSANVTNNDVEVTSGILAAFVGDEVRGVAKSSEGKWLVFPPTGKTIVSLTIYSNVSSGETLTFKLYDGSNIYDIENSIEFTSNGIFGNAVNPVEFKVVQPEPLPRPEEELYEIDNLRLRRLIPWNTSYANEFVKMVNYANDNGGFYYTNDQIFTEEYGNKILSPSFQNIIDFNLPVMVIVQRKEMIRLYTTSNYLVQELEAYSAFLDIPGVSDIVPQGEIDFPVFFLYNSVDPEAEPEPA